ncbi:16S rRNA (guanine(527)-N(7))-methyltransferase RsmG [Desulfomicrobium escambiense]|uniref:16S rRNA (guanine(527)-N(7))-methyltransferase RsmG n=1 Tax=Desulfomicrobium escambiense TaxID=29503 RepID=UPI00041D08BD|nr:16S rRNA (guanine(527)-N(7))-methyltransferase RsmG [Desulfomicrobium escambiense]
MNETLDAASVAAASARLGRVLTDDQAGMLAVYLGLLVKWNSRMNLVGPETWPEILETLIQDSWHLADLLQTIEPQPAETLDLGAGAGLPGIPLRVFWTAGDYWLVEPRQKRALFMEQAAAHMRLPRTRVLCARMEALPQARRQAGLIVSRAFMPWKKLLAEVRGYLAPGGRVLVMSNEATGETVEGFALDVEKDYAVAGKTRWFRLFRLVGEDF